MKSSASSKAARARRTLALFLPWLPSERIIRALGPPEHPFALTAKIRGAMVIMAADRQAVSLGLGPGMKLADARARVPDLLAFDHDPLADADLLSRLAEACERYTPMVAVEPPHALILDISGAAHFYASETALAQDAEDRLDTAGYSACWALAGTPAAALALARHGLKEGAEAQLPVAALAMDEKTHQALEQAGLYKIGDLAERPRANLAARFGMDLTLGLDRILGLEDRPIDPLRRIGNIVTERRFAEPLTHIDAALECLSDLFAEAAERLNERGQGARMIRMLLFRCDGDIARLGLETGAPTRDVALFQRLLRERIEALNDPLNPGFGYDLIRLSITTSEVLAPQQLRLEGGEDQQGDAVALLSQISTRLGRERVQTFAPADSHIPEQGLLALPALNAPAPVAWQMQACGEPPMRPLHMFDPPQRVQVIAEVPDGPPYRFTWRRKTHQVIRYEGPERIASEWWQRKDGQQPGNGGLTRDYYRVEDARGRRYWLFRHGLYGEEKANPDWYVHGLFA
ncbi:MAG: DNA polymerase Y family protein [Sphingomonadales bacterium]|nr:DNA polymerase Y family protein [Sphingomonadales bacterium]PIX66917.1 MAG: nucleotidyltransferase [Sphingomonadales bacterium CG_4_10_14_3_um_filter_58_15]NCP01483.1 DNA polymerase Y family protein [Sphingomonadales bacterium]NCP26817.1 DNA polymerase Y family protein [Sphingomonadales bacterium]NCP43459.1 DNA polymerase Y family protein [Sphingomonadales bacterium]